MYISVKDKKAVWKYLIRRSRAKQNSVRCIHPFLHESLACEISTDLHTELSGSKNKACFLASWRHLYPMEWSSSIDESFCKLITVCENILARGNIFFQARIQSNGFSHKICIFFYSTLFFSSTSFPCIPYSIHISCYVYLITLFFFVYLFNIFSFLLIVSLWSITLTM